MKPEVANGRDKTDIQSEFKLEDVRLVRQRGVSVAQAARQAQDLAAMRSSAQQFAQAF